MATVTIIRRRIMYLVHAKAPGALAHTGWDFRSGFFPRKVRLKKDAKELAEEAKKKGGIDVRIEKIK